MALPSAISHSPYRARFRRPAEFNLYNRLEFMFTALTPLANQIRTLSLRMIHRKPGQ